MLSLVIKKRNQIKKSYIYIICYDGLYVGCEADHDYDIKAPALSVMTKMR